MPGGEREAAEFEEWTEFPNDGYDYEQHILTAEKAEEIVAAGGGRQKMFVVAPLDLSELQKNPYFTGELEANPDYLTDEEREITLMLREQEELESESSSEVEALVKQMMEEELSDAETALPLHRGDDSSVLAEASSNSGDEDDDSEEDIFDATLAKLTDQDLLNAMNEMNADDEDFEEARVLEPQVLREDISAVNACVNMYLKTESSAARQKVKPAGLDNRAFIEAAIARQLEEEGEDASSEDADEVEQEHEFSGFQFDRSLFTNMSQSRQPKESAAAATRNRPPVQLKEAKKVDLNDLIF